MDSIRADLISYPWNARIPDATGRARHCRLLVSRENLRKYPSTLPRPFARKLLWRLNSAILLPMLIPPGILFVVAATLMPSPPLSRAPGQVWPSIAVAAATYVAFLAPGVAIVYTLGWAPMRRTYRRAHTAALLEARRCPWCLYDLRGVPANIHDLTTCPECGGRWQFPTPAPTL